MNDRILSPRFETETLERLKFAMQRHFSAEVVQALDVNWIQDHSVVRPGARAGRGARAAAVSVSRRAPDPSRLAR